MTPSKEVLLQLPEFQAWARASSTPITLFDFATFVATPDLFFAFGALFVPETCSHNGLLFLANGFDSSIYDAWKSKGYSDRDVQRVMNHIHISLIFQSGDVGDEIASAATGALSQIWQRTLGEGVLVECGGSNLADCYVTFFER